MGKIFMCGFGGDTSAAMPKSGGAFTGDATFETGKMLRFKITGTNKELRLYSNGTSGVINLLIIDLDTSEVFRILSLDPTAGTYADSTTLMPKSGGTFTGQAATTMHTTPTSCSLKNIVSCDSAWNIIANENSCFYYALDK